MNLATERKEDFGLVLTRYGLERVLYRLSVSPHRDSFVLKGALLLQLWTAETYRPTRDLDLLGRGISNISCRKIFSEACSQNLDDDGLMFLPDTIRVERIRDDEVYEDDFERFVFVMSVLEQYSDQECLLLLASSPREIREARARAFAQLGKSTRIVSREADFERVQALLTIAPLL